MAEARMSFGLLGGLERDQIKADAEHGGFRVRDEVTLMGGGLYNLDVVAPCTKQSCGAEALKKAFSDRTGNIYHCSGCPNL